MIVGVIPGPSAPKGNINTFLAPLVDDLLLLKDGLDFLPNGSIVKAAPLGFLADTPALRKVAQFLGHKGAPVARLRQNVNLANKVHQGR